MVIRFIDEHDNFIERWDDYNGIIPLIKDTVTLTNNGVINSYTVVERLLPFETKNAFSDEVTLVCTLIRKVLDKEERLINKLKQIAGITNEIYGTDYPGPLAAFCTFFEVKHGIVVLKSDIRKDNLIRYSKNL